MNLGPLAAGMLVECIKPAAKGIKSRIWIAPPFVSISAALEKTRETPIKVGAQNAHWEDAGAYTGEVSIPMLKEVGAEFVIVGHSERRNLFKESDDQVALRAKAVLSSSLFLILCIGESAEQRNRGETNFVLEEQLRKVLIGRTERELASLIVAYEPLWAIGTGTSANQEQIADAHGHIRTTLKEFSKVVRPPILYGGSVTPDNFTSIISVPDVDGALVGGVSLLAEKFNKLIEIAESR